ncbi:LysE family transporter [Shouchella shacheensis]|uniref:LysE family transporter n=1 Tax=Shouchella shacheensis TaxID=1649580 RepID=UPI00073FB8EC|nr:LysE family transporter [Shouchella shacheensis]
MSVSVLFSYILLGLTLAAPIGPVNAARIDKGIKNGFTHSWVVGVGSMLADAIFMLLVYFGVGQFLDAPIVQTFLWLFGAFILCYSGVEAMMKANQVTLNHSRKKDSLFSCLFTGFIMSISNPLSMLFWLGIYGSVLAKTATTTETGDLLIYSCMIFVGLTIWDLFIAGISSGSRRFLSARLLKAIAVLSGLSLVGFGVYFGFHGVEILLKGR